MIHCSAAVVHHALANRVSLALPATVTAAACGALSTTAQVDNMVDSVYCKTILLPGAHPAILNAFSK